MEKILTLGEALVDFIPMETGVPRAEVSGFRKRFGGAPANVAVGLSKLGKNAGFIGKVGADGFGDFIEKKLKEEDVDVNVLYRTEKVHTTITFVELGKGGEREFEFYRNPGADELLKPEEVRQSYLRGAKFLHFGSLSLTGEFSREATFRAIAFAEEGGALISMDPNIRLSLWEGKEEAKNTVRKVLDRVDLLKLNIEEASFLSGENTPEKAAGELNKLGPKLVVITLGGGGCFARYGDGELEAEGLEVETKDTTGAGDAFTAGFLKSISEAPEGINDLRASDIKEAMNFANAAGALATTSYGAVSSLPDAAEIEGLIDKRS